jgi:hypothetical protein
MGVARRRPRCHDPVRRIDGPALAAALHRRTIAESVGLESARSQFGAVMMLDLDYTKGTCRARGSAVGAATPRHANEAAPCTCAAGPASASPAA